MLEPDRMLIFDLKGKFAHFRKFYTNSSSLSYVFPPRTTLEGTLAAMMGKERDSYYDLFSPKDSLIAVSPRNSVRSIMQTLNYLFVKSPGDLNGRNSRTQVPFELIVPRDFGQELIYRVFFFHKNVELMKEVIWRIRENTLFFPISFGVANLLCRAEFVDDVPLTSETISNSREERTHVVTPVPDGAYKEIKLLTDDSASHRFVLDTFPFHFMAKRIPQENVKLIYDTDFRPVMVGRPDLTTVVRYRDGTLNRSEAVVFAEHWREGG